MVLKLDLSLVDHSLILCSTLVLALIVIRTNFRSKVLWVGVFVCLVARVGYFRLHFPPLLKISARVTLIDLLEPSQYQVSIYTFPFGASLPQSG